MHLGQHVDDEALLRAELELKGLMSGLPPQDGPSQPYWDMFATRTMARINRGEENKSVPSLLKRFWIPGAVMAVASAAVFVFMLTRAVEQTLDSTTAQLPTEEIQAIRNAEAPLVPVGMIDAQVSTELVTKVTARHADMDAVLAFSDIEPAQLSAIIHESPLGGEVYGLDELSAADDDTLVSMLQQSM